MGIPHSKSSLSLLMVSKDSVERYMRWRKKSPTIWRSRHWRRPREERVVFVEVAVECVAVAVDGVGVIFPRIHAVVVLVHAPDHKAGHNPGWNTYTLQLKQMGIILRLCELMQGPLVNATGEAYRSRDYFQRRGRQNISQFVWDCKKCYLTKIWLPNFFNK
jgi:hypothetical protein